jgi:hypothetical protein
MSASALIFYGQYAFFGIIPGIVHEGGNAVGMEFAFIQGFAV